MAKFNFRDTLTLLIILLAFVKTSAQDNELITNNNTVILQEDNSLKEYSELNGNNNYSIQHQTKEENNQQILSLIVDPNVKNSGVFVLDSYGQLHVLTTQKNVSSWSPIGSSVSDGKYAPLLRMQYTYAKGNYHFFVMGADYQAYHISVSKNLKKISNWKPWGMKIKIENTKPPQFICLNHNDKREVKLAVLEKSQILYMTYPYSDRPNTIEHGIWRQQGHSTKDFDYAFLAHFKEPKHFSGVDPERYLALTVDGSLYGLQTYKFEKVINDIFYPNSPANFMFIADSREWFKEEYKLSSAPITGFQFFYNTRNSVINYYAIDEAGQLYSMSEKDGKLYDWRERGTKVNAGSGQYLLHLNTALYGRAIVLYTIDSEGQLYRYQTFGKNSETWEAIGESIFSKKN